MTTKPKALGSSIPTYPRLLGLGWLPDLTRLKRLRFSLAVGYKALESDISIRSKTIRFGFASRPKAIEKTYL